MLPKVKGHKLQSSFRPSSLQGRFGHFWSYWPQSGTYSCVAPDTAAGSSGDSGSIWEAVKCNVQCGVFGATGDLHLFLKTCCLVGVDIFLNPFFKWSHRWSEDKARHAAWPFLKSSVCSLCQTRRGSCYTMDDSLHSFPSVRWHWNGKEGSRALEAKCWGFHTWQNSPIYSIKMWYLISYASCLCLFGRNTNIAFSSAMHSGLSYLFVTQGLLWNSLWYKTRQASSVVSVL